MESNEVVIASYLYKRSKKTHQWKSRWVVLRQLQLSYYKDSSEHKPLKVIPIKNLLSTSEVQDSQRFRFAIYTNNKVIHFKCESEKELRKWMECLRELIDEHDDTKHMIKEVERLHMESEGPISPTVLPHSRQNQPNGNLPEIVPPPLSGDQSDGEESSFYSSEISDSGFAPNTSITHIPPPPTIQELQEEEEREEKLDSQRSQLEVKDNEANESVRLSEHDEYIVEQGYLLRLKKRFMQWKKYYLVLTNKTLYFYNSKQSALLKNILPYKTISCDHIVDVIDVDPLSRSKVWCLLIITPTKRIRFCASSEEEVEKWFAALQAVILSNKKTD
ncbi:uncharacterized protein KQ657_000179 [Scheffersomyces spartinae]|uniref:PH domain-containing protein n=1 Tax=Scheffersomyces spartinae TaxID=45513 RepID=A0A9P7VEF9_9ASCO|nr:uncharacterized protein KQ657_000179 [Scheffersomyces spartinae]KAG7196167.1 hypothetical protein KQ657_000179 [Scheffersomyces spartinae]